MAPDGKRQGKALENMSAWICVCGHDDLSHSPQSGACTYTTCKCVYFAIVEQTEVNKLREDLRVANLKLSEWSKTLNWIRNTHRCNGWVSPGRDVDCSICNAIDEALLGKSEKKEGV
jgi:hypothetical protein